MMITGIMLFKYCEVPTTRSAKFYFIKNFDFVEKRHTFMHPNNQISETTLTNGSIYFKIYQFFKNEHYEKTLSHLRIFLLV